MHPRPTTVLLAVLLTSGCMAVPHTPAPVPPTRPAGLAPANERPPVPLPTWPAPAQGAPREELATTGALPASASTTPAAPAAPAPEKHPRAHPEAGQSDRRTQPRKRPGVSPVTAKKSPKPVNVGRRTTPPKVQAPKEKKRPAARRQQPAGGQPDMRQLCREAGRINVPMGAADLCRSAYGR
ncbi:hypothetical protein [Streptomyces zaomyceticus]|uniref:hypothetical protein n=1 Tax=Streptomyces zaomyceticus TaxID=68286 RepID=UPI0036ABFED7